MYNMLFGMNPMSEIFLATLGLSKADTGRFRDCYVEKDGNEYKIAVYTRNGGGNRDYCMPDFSGHPNFLYDRDDDFDGTYATIYFSIPDKYKLQLEQVAVADAKTISDKFLDLTEKMKDGDTDNPVVKNALEVGKKIFEAIKKEAHEIHK